MENSQQRSWLSWAFVSLLVLLCGVLAALQYRWIGEITEAERSRLGAELHSRLGSLSRAFNQDIASACSALLVSSAQVEQMGREGAYAAQFLRWKESHGPLFRRIALAVPEDDSLRLLNLDLEAAKFAPMAWPSEWSAMQNRLTGRLQGAGMPPSAAEGPALFEFPRFGLPRESQRVAEQEWLLLELNLDYVRGTLLPELLNRYLGEAGRLDYDVEVVDATNSSTLIYASAPGHQHAIEGQADASVFLLDVQPNGFGGPGGRREPRGGPGPTGRPAGPGRNSFGRQGPEFGRSEPPLEGERGGRRFGPGFGGPPGTSRGGPRGPGFGEGGNGAPPNAARGRYAGTAGGPGMGGAPAPDGGRGRWRLVVRHSAGSLDALVARTRRRNLGVSAAVLMLILATVAALVRFSRRAQQVADLQMNFVAGISHELRTPISVIRTAAFNLRGKLASRPDQVERYGALIQTESEKLQGLVEQVLRFASAKAGHVIRAREPASVATLIEEGLHSSRAVLQDAGLVVEKRIDPNLPPVLADGAAMRHAIQNLVENALKYGTEGSNWIGIFVAAVNGEKGPAVEIRIADRGPGIPADEQDRIFDPFFRGRGAVQDQVHGTGLGLNLVKKIVEAHGGTIQVSSEPPKGTEFIIRIPAAPPEQHELAHSLD